MADPVFEAAGEIFDGAVAGLRQAIEGAPADTLNARPAGEETNTIAVLATHAMHSTRSWFAVATGAPLPIRDRPSEFRVTASSAEELLGFVDAMRQDCRALLASEAPFEPGASRVTHRPGSAGDPDRVTSAWALLHALEHLQEHVGHAQLTRQVLDSRPDTLSG